MSEANDLMMNGLPEGWQWVKLESLVENPKQDIVDGPFGSNLKSHEYVNDGVPVFKIQNIKANRFVDKNLSHVTEEKAKALSRHSFKAGDLIITKLGDPLGLCCKVPDKYPQGIIVADLMRLRPSKRKVYDKFLINVINSDVVQSQFKTITKGTTRPRVNLTIVRDIEIPLPSLEDQKRIISRVEELSSELDKSIEELKMAQQQLKLYRQSVLKWALEGKLTEIWREQQENLIDSGEVLKNINKERKDVALINKIKLKPIPAISEDELSKLPELPKRMCWVRLGELLWSVKDGPHYSPKYESSGIPFISGGNIRPQGIEFSNTKFISQELHRELSKRCKPEKGDILYTKGGTTGIARVNTYDAEFNVWVHVAVLKPVKYINPFYLQHALNSLHCYRQSQRFTHGVGNQDLGLTRMILITLPICSLEEQTQIVQEIESRLSVADKVEETIVNSLEQAEALRQSILKKAFEGKLTC